MENKMERPD